MSWRVALGLLGALWAGSAAAQIMPPGFPPGVFLSRGALDPAPITYVGPGDVVSGAAAWYGLRAYNAAYAAPGTNKAINIRRASDNATSDIVILTTGDIDVASAASFLGTDATASCSTTGLSTTMACTGASSTPHVNDQIYGTGLTQPVYLAAVGTFTGGAGSVTLSQAENVAVAETVTFQVAGLVTEAYDQTGNARHLTQATATQQPQFLFNCFGALPCLSFTSTSSTALRGNSGLGAQPATLSVAAYFTSGYGSIFGPQNAGGVGFALATYTSNNLVYLYAGTTGFTPSAAGGVLHAFQVVVNGSSSHIVVDATDNTGSPGTSAAQSTQGMGASNNGPPYVNGRIVEAGSWASAFNSTQWGAMCHNQYLYWGTAASC